jgi:hypothetical protein
MTHKGRNIANAVVIVGALIAFVIGFIAFFSVSVYDASKEPRVNPSMAASNIHRAPEKGNIGGDGYEETPKPPPIFSKVVPPAIQPAPIEDRVHTPRTFSFHMDGNVGGGVQQDGWFTYEPLTLFPGENSISISNVRGVICLLPGTRGEQCVTLYGENVKTHEHYKPFQLLDIHGNQSPIWRNFISTDLDVGSLLVWVDGKGYQMASHPGENGIDLGNNTDLTVKRPIYVAVNELAPNRRDPNCPNNSGVWDFDITIK